MAYYNGGYGSGNIYNGGGGGRRPLSLFNQNFVGPRPMWYEPSSEKERAKFEECKNTIREHLLTCKHGVTPTQIINWLTEVGEDIPHQKFGLTFNQFLFHCQEFIQVRKWPSWQNSRAKLLFLAEGAVRPEDAHIRELVLKQSNGSRRRPGTQAPNFQNTVRAAPEELLDAPPPRVFTDSIQPTPAPRRPLQNRYTPTFGGSGNNTSRPVMNAYPPPGATRRVETRTLPRDTVDSTRLRTVTGTAVQLPRSGPPAAARVFAAAAPFLLPAPALRPPTTKPTSTPKLILQNGAPSLPTTKPSSNTNLILQNGAPSPPTTKPTSTPNLILQNGTPSLPTTKPTSTPKLETLTSQIVLPSNACAFNQEELKQHGKFVNGKLVLPMILVGSNTEDQGRFELQLQEIGNQVTRLESMMNLYYNFKEESRKPVPFNELVRYGCYAAYDRDRAIWCRVQILNLSENKNKVSAMLMDHGIIKDIDAKDICYMRSAHVKNCVRHAYSATCLYRPNEPRLGRAAFNFFMRLNRGMEVNVVIHDVEMTESGPLLKVRFVLNIPDEKKSSGSGDGYTY